MPVRAPHRVAFTVFALFVAYVAPAFAAPVPAVGVAGDSLSDEYAFPINFPPGGDRRTAKNFIEILATARGVDFGPLSATPRPTPRNEGYEYNFAFDGAASADLIAQGQHTGVAGLASGGTIGLATLTVGGNDWRNVFTSPDPVAAIPMTVTSLLTNVVTAAQTMLAASPTLKVVIGNAPDIRYIPQLRAAVAGGVLPQALVDAVSGAIGVYNEQLALAFAGNARVAIANLNGVITDAMTADQLRIGGALIDRATPGNDTRNFFVDAIHPGTAASALLANEYIDAMNGAFDYDIDRLSGQEIRELAGGELAVPLPPAVWTGGATLLIAAGSAVRAARARHAA